VQRAGDWQQPLAPWQAEKQPVPPRAYPSAGQIVYFKSHPQLLLSAWQQAKYGRLPGPGVQQICAPTPGLGHCRPGKIVALQARMALQPGDIQRHLQPILFG
jgi:hypothetical protein